MNLFKKIPLHFRERLKCKSNKVKREPKLELIKSEPEVEFVKTTISHPKYRLLRKAKKLADENSTALLNDFLFDQKKLGKVFDF